MKKIALAALVTAFGYMSAQAQAPAKSSPHDGKDGNHTYVVPAKVANDKAPAGGKHIANRSKTGKNNKSMLNRGSRIKAAEVKPVGAKPHPMPGFHHDKGKKKGHHKHHGNNGYHNGHNKHQGCNKPHTSAVSPTSNNSVSAGPVRNVSATNIKGNTAAPIVHPATSLKGGAK